MSRRRAPTSGDGQTAWLTKGITMKRERDILWIAELEQAIEIERSTSSDDWIDLPNWEESDSI